MSATKGGEDEGVEGLQGWTLDLGWAESRLRETRQAWEQHGGVSMSWRNRAAEVFKQVKSMENQCKIWEGISAEVAFTRMSDKKNKNKVTLIYCKTCLICKIASFLV